MIEVAKALIYNQHLILRELSSPAPVPYTYLKSEILLNIISSKNHLANFDQISYLSFCWSGLSVCSNGHAPLTVVPIYGK